MIFWALPLIQDLGYIASGEEVRSKETVILSSVGDWNTSSTLGLGSNGLLLIRCNATSFSNPRNYLKVRRDQPTCQLKNKPVLLTKRRSCSRTGFSSQILGHLSTRSVFESFFPVYFFLPLFLPVYLKTLNMTCVRLRPFWTDTWHPNTYQCIHQICTNTYSARRRVRTNGEIYHPV